MSQLESNSALSASFRLGTAAARMDLRLQPFLPLVMPGPFLELAGAGAASASLGLVPSAPAVLGLAPPDVSAAALAALHLTISSGVRVLHSAGE